MPGQRRDPSGPRVPVIIVHGGAGADPVEGRDELRAGVSAAAAAGWRVLAQDGRALDAVEAAVRALEDHPRFNAGRGSALTSAGTVEMDASIMEGERLDCGAVAAVSGVTNPVTLARRVLESGRHVLLAGAGALAFAREAGVPECDPASLITERQRRRFGGQVTAAVAPAAAAGAARAVGAEGTVGAVALDRHGAVAAATSTGGTWGKRPGRVGDSALIGCGTYADRAVGGVSCTGAGEAIIRVVLARRALDYLKEADDPAYAASVAVDLLVEEGRGQGGLILLDWRGRTGYAHSTPLMPVAWMSPALAGPRVPF
jgi:beta-aspartyl-peptidase (threonine type)